jgi:peptide/nickel transport system permease protein
MASIDIAPAPADTARAEGLWSKIRYHAAAHPLGLVGAAIMAVFVFAAIFADFITSYDPIRTNSAITLLPPNHLHWLGADQMGRDIYSRIVYGARISLAVGLGSTFLGSLFGVVLGLASGYIGGWVDLVIQRIVDVLQAVPLLVLALVMAAALGPALDNTIVAIAIPLVPYTARIIRSNTLTLREQPFVEAARAAGTGFFRTLWRHILPNTAAPVLVQATYICASAMITEAVLSFIGAGTPPQIPSWGNIMAEGRSYFQLKPHLIIFPGIFLSLTVLAVNLLGDGLRDALDPRLARRM